MMKLLFLFLMVVLLGSSCRNHAKNLASCKENYRQAYAAWAGFYQHSDTSLLRKALPLFRKSMACKEIKRKAIMKTIGILYLLKEFRLAYLFVDSLGTDDFDRPYIKAMCSYFYRSEFIASQGDMRLKALLLDSTIQSVNVYLRSENEFDKESLIDLLFFQSLLPTRGRMNHTVDSFKRRYPEQAKSIEELRYIGEDSPAAESTSK